MTEANGGVDPTTQPGWRWDVALSFAGAQRDYVEQVAQALKGRGVRCFYDADEQIELWGRHLAEELPAIYGEQAAVVVVFVSAEYARDWTRLERRAALGRVVRERREYVLPARFDNTLLPGLPSDIVTVDLRHLTPQQFAEMIAGKLAALAVSPPSAHVEDLAQNVQPVRPAGAVRVAEADPRWLGVHAAITVPGAPNDVLPEYVPRDVDNAEHGVRAKVAAATRRGGFVLLVGGSSVGKTRCAVEAVKTLLPEWWLVHPTDPDQIAALATAPVPQTVVWLDELQRYLDGEHGLTGAVVQALLDPSHPTVIIGTLWPDRYITYTTVPPPGGSDPHAREREVLDLAAVIRIDPEFSEAEQGRARAAAVRDPRLLIALESARYGLTQTLAAAPQLVARWEDAKTASPYAWAVLTAALDAARLGARTPLSAGLLRAAAPGYLTGQQQAKAPGNWFELALAYATGKLRGASAALSPVGVGMSQIAGYTVANYLIQQASRERRSARVPASTWDALLSYIRDPADAKRLADSARHRLLYCYAIPLYRHAADAGDGFAASRLAELLAGYGDLDGLRARADAGDGAAARRLADLLAEAGELDGAAQTLRVLADAGDPYAAWRLADLLAEHGDLDGLRTRADAGDRSAAWRLADLLEDRGDLDEAVQILRAAADADDGSAARRLAGMLAEHGDLDGAMQVLQVLRPWTDARDLFTTGPLAEHGDLEGLRARVDVGNGSAAGPLADLLDHGNPDRATQVLHALADVGIGSAASRLADLLVQRGDVDGLRARADAGDPFAAWRLAGLLAERGDLDGLRARADAGDGSAAWRLAELLAERGDLDGLRARAGDGDGSAAWRLAELLAERGDLDGLRARADAGDGSVAGPLADLLTKQGRREEAARLRRFGLNPDGSIAALGIVALAPSADAEGRAWDAGPVRPVGAVRTAETEADAATSVLSEALDVLSDVLTWQLATLRWHVIKQVLDAMDAALQANNLEALAEATIQLELSGPLRTTRIGGTSISAPTDVIRAQVVHLIHSLRDRRARGERHSGGAGQ
jgi:TIR domain